MALTSELRGRPAGTLYLAAFAFSLFTSAFLLFAMEPMVSRLVLPRLGGTPSVWNTCVCFFQAGLLIGYGYAHISAARLRLPVQVALHAALLLTAMALLPLSLGHDAPPAASPPVLWLLARLTTAIGLPFAAIAATAPLLQTWFSRTTHPQASDPYFLYAASNAGSLVALLSYPSLIETTLGLSVQAACWSIGFVVTAASIIVCGTLAVRGDTGRIVAASGPSAAIPMAERLRWLALSFIPSGLMLAVTTHITTDIASAPLFWVAPLALYILTFVAAYARRQVLSPKVLGWAQALTLIAAGCIPLAVRAGSLPTILAPLLAFTATAAACHFELARRRPDPAHLTGYFMLISLGGALGGWFCALLAPVIFNSPLEYPLLLIAACLLRDPPPQPTNAAWAVRGDLLLPLAVGGIIVAIAYFAGSFAGNSLGLIVRVSMAIVPAAALLCMARRRVRFGLTLAVCFAIPILAVPAELSARSFFGVFRVLKDPRTQLVKLQHGTTIHGVESLRPGEALVPLSYYNHRGPFGRLFDILGRSPRPLESVGVIGLGTGALSCYKQPGQTWDFREIDPLAERLAKDERWFHFMAGCGRDIPVILGDARITLTADTVSQYDLLVVDAFNSDSVPVHLITREALALYFAHLRPGGMVAFHVSNRLLDLVPVVARMAADAGAPARHLRVENGTDVLREPATEVVVVGAPGTNLDGLTADGWDTPAAGPTLWTDDRSDIVSVVRW